MFGVLSIITLAAAASASILLPRTATQVLSDLKTLDTDVNKCTAVCQSWTSGFSGGVALQNCEQQVESDLKALVRDCQSTPVLSDADSASIINYINNPLEPDIKALITCIQQHKPQVESNGFKTTVQQDFQTLKNLTNSAGSCFIAASPSSRKSSTQAAFNKILADIQSGITTYSS